MKNYLLLLLIFIIYNYCNASTTYPKDNILKMNMIQLKGSHNSYALANVVVNALKPRLRYAHIDIKEQLQRGARGIELDVFFLSDGKRYFVYHDKNIAGTTCSRLKDCLNKVKEFTNENPTHHWIHHLIEIKENPGWTEAQCILAIEQEYIDVFGLNGLIKVSDIKKHHSSLQYAVQTDGWPTLGETRGKQLLTIQFASSNEENTQIERNRLNDIYNSSTVAFGFARQNKSQDEPWAIVQQVSRHDVKNRPNMVTSLLNRNLILRSRADADLDEFFFREIMINSSIQIISTDYIYPCKDRSDGYFVELPNGEPSRCNPVLAPNDCVPKDIETGITSIEIQREAPRNFECCHNSDFYMYVIFIIMGFVALSYIPFFRTCCNDASSLTLFLMHCLLITCFLVVFFTRAITDVLIQRFQLKPDDLLVSVAIILRQVLLAIIYGRLTNTIGRFERCVGILLASIGIIVSLAGSDKQLYGYGCLSGEKAFLYLQIIHTLYTLFLCRQIIQKNEGKFETIDTLTKIVLFLLLCDAPQLLLFSILDSIRGLYPIRTMLMQLLGTRVVAWHNLMYSFQILISTFIVSGIPTKDIAYKSQVQVSI